MLLSANWLLSLYLLSAVCLFHSSLVFSTQHLSARLLPAPKSLISVRPVLKVRRRYSISVTVIVMKYFPGIFVCVFEELWLHHSHMEMICGLLLKRQNRKSESLQLFCSCTLDAGRNRARAAWVNVSKLHLATEDAVHDECMRCP